MGRAFFAGLRSGAGARARKAGRGGTAPALLRPLIRALGRITPSNQHGARYAVEICARAWLAGDLSLSLLWEPRDLWLGVYWDKRIEQVYYRIGQPRPDGSEYINGMYITTDVYHCYVCLLPTLPLLLRWHDGRVARSHAALQGWRIL